MKSDHLNEFKVDWICIDFIYLDFFLHIPINQSGHKPVFHQLASSCIASDQPKKQVINITEIFS